MDGTGAQAPVNKTKNGMVYMDVNKLLSLLAPSICRTCGDPGVRGMDLCPPCYRALPENLIACPRCAEPMTTRGLLCGRCLANPPPFARVRAPWLYAPPMDWLIQELKFNGRLASGRLLGQLLGRRLRKAGVVVDRILPMPLHGTRLRERGFNQATEIARPVARALGLPLDTRSLLRDRPTARQASLPLEQRAGNVAAAFSADGALDGLRVAVVDDVVTTTSTARAVASALRKAGAEHVELWVVSRAGRNLTGVPLSNHTPANAWTSGSG